MAKKKKGQDEKKEEKYFFSKSGYIYASLIFTFGTSYCQLVGFITRRDDSSTIIQVVIVDILFILPVRFLMTLIGHYSQSSSVAIGWMQPIMAGYSFCVIVSTVLTMINGFVMLRDLGIYLIYTITSGGRVYLDCKYYTSVKIYCIDSMNTVDEIADESMAQGYPLNTTNLVSYIFYQSVILQRSVPSKEKSLAYQRITVKMIHGVLSFAVPTFIFFMVQIKMSKMFKILKPIALFIICLMSLEIVLMLTLEGPADELREYFIKMKDRWRYTDSQIWLSTIVRRMMVYAPLNAHHISFAAMLDPKVSTEVATLECWIVDMLMGFMKTACYLCVKGSLHREIIQKSDTSLPIIKEYVTIYIPAANSFLYTGDSTFLFLFFTGEFVLLSLKNSVFIQLIFNSLTDIFPFVAQYKRYIVATFLVAMAFTCYFFFSSDDMDEEVNWLNEGQTYPVWIILVVLSVFTLWFYGVNNLCEDFHFKVGYAPSIFWKISLWPLPFTLLLTIILNWPETSPKLTKKFEGAVNSSYIVLIVIQVLYAVPFSIRTIYEVIQYVLNKKLLWLVKPQERWGDPDPQERRARAKYPPRLETKVRRRFDYCNHRCLRYNNVLQALDEKEYDTRAALLNIPQELIEEKKYIYSIIRNIRE